MRRTLPAVLLTGWLILVGIAGATSGAPLANGDFSIPGVPPDPFAVWTTAFGAFPTNGGGFALFSESPTFAQTELEQTFSLLPGSGPLAFEFLLSTTPNGTPGIPPDSFQATLYDSSLNPFPNPADPLLPAFYSIDATGQEFFDAAFVSVTTLANGGKRVTLDVSALPPQDVLLEFILNGGDDGRTTTASLDNVSVNAVPEPRHVLPFLATAFGWLAARRPRRDAASAAGSRPGQEVSHSRKLPRAVPAKPDAGVRMWWFWNPGISHWKT
jgi:hypothetical protein